MEEHESLRCTGMKRTELGGKRSSESDTSTPTSTEGEKLSPRFAVCVDNLDYPASLELHKIYRVLADPAAEAEGELRVIDESGEDYLYSASRFMPIELPAALERSLLRT